MTHLAAIRKPAVVAHRGYSARYPENTLQAIEAAIHEAHADGVELDIHITADRQLILQHDATLDRMTNGTGPVCNRPWNGHIDALMTTGGQLPVSRFGDVLSYLKTCESIRIRSNCFILVVDVKEDQPLAVLDVLASELGAFDAPSANVAVFVGTWTDEFAHHARSVLPAYVKHTWIGDDWPVERVASPLHDAFNVDIDHVTRASTLHARQLRKPVFAWTCNDEQQVRLAHLLALQAILVDDPLHAHLHLSQ